jgi:hypothetical protein
MYIYTFLLRMTDTMTSQNIDLPPGTLCIVWTLTVVTRKKVNFSDHSELRAFENRVLRSV